jgi:hypothetical protein
MKVQDFMRSMREHFGTYEFKATSPEGHVITSKGWKEKKHRVGVVPLIVGKPK